jgi:LAO/AO transport system kinase
MQTISADDIKLADFRAIARGISMVENGLPGADELMKSIRFNPVPIIGVTGPPGAGKSTLVDAITNYLSKGGRKIAILCVDPSSSFHTGAILGDRIRMNRWHDNPNVFIRSMASRGAVGGLNPRVFQIADLLAHAGFDYIIVETVGVGQTEIDIAKIADQVLLVLVPESGDDIQAMKSGVMEIADIFVINKSDRPGSAQFLQSLRTSLHYRSSKPDHEIPLVQTVATEGIGIVELYNEISENLKIRSPHHELSRLTQKAWQIISDFRMRDLNKDSLKNSLEMAMKDPSFNIYRFAEKNIH